MTPNWERRMPQGISRRNLLKSSAAAGAAFVASPLRAQAPSAVAVTPELIAAAQKEGRLGFYTAMDLPVAEKLAKAFEAKYSGVAVRVERSGAERVFQRVAQEMASNIHACDVLNSSDAAHFIAFKRSGWLAPYVSDEMAQHFPAIYRDPDGQFVTTRVWLSSLGYNTELVKDEDAPKSLADLLDPKWAGKMVKAHPAYSGTIMTATFQIVRELGWGYFEKLATQRIMQVQSSTDPPKKLALGERAVMADGNDYNLIQLKEAGQPVEVVIRPKARRSSPARARYSSRRPTQTPRACSRTGCIRSRRSSSWSILPVSIRSTPSPRRSRGRAGSTRSSCGRTIPPASSA